MPSSQDQDPNRDPETDPDLRRVWALTEFASFFFGTLQRIYMPELPGVLSTFFRVKPDVKGR